MANRSIQSSPTNILLRYKEAYSLPRFDFRSRDNGHVGRSENIWPGESCKSSLDHSTAADGSEVKAAD